MSSIKKNLPRPNALLPGTELGQICFHSIIQIKTKKYFTLKNTQMLFIPLFRTVSKLRAPMKPRNKYQ